MQNIELAHKGLVSSMEGAVRDMVNFRIPSLLWMVLECWNGCPIKTEPKHPSWDDAGPASQYGGKRLLLCSAPCELTFVQREPCSLHQSRKLCAVACAPGGLVRQRAVNELRPDVCHQFRRQSPRRRAASVRPWSRRRAVSSDWRGTPRRCAPRCRARWRSAGSCGHGR